MERDNMQYSKQILPNHTNSTDCIAPICVSSTQATQDQSRVRDFGEVFTAQREVKAMCDMVDSTIAMLDSRILEPSCGNGNFIEEILHRKITTLESTFLSNTSTNAIALYQNSLIIIACSIYGIDILKDNIKSTRKRMLRIISERYTSYCRESLPLGLAKILVAIIEANIICGDTLKDAIIVCEWELDSSANATQTLVDAHKSLHIKAYFLSDIGRDFGLFDIPIQAEITLCFDIPFFAQAIRSFVFSTAKPKKPKSTSRRIHAKP